MSFLQPLLLFGIPLIGLPILVHLMNQRRFQTIDWGAMVFLLAANRMSRGFSRIRRWLILAARTLAVAGVIFAMARPLSRGWLGWAAGNRTDTTIVLLDRSPSMSAMDENHVASKLTAGRQRLADAFETLRSNHWVLIDSATGQPTELANASDMLSAAESEQSDASADLPAMLQTAYQYIQSNQTGHTDVWICSDLRRHDWDPEGGRWRAVRDSFLQLPQTVRFYLLAFPELPARNRSIRVTSVKRNERDDGANDGANDGAELLVSLEIKRPNQQEAETIPVEFNIDGARSVLNVEMAGSKFELADHRIPLGPDQVRGWGRVSIPADTLEEDNDFFFVFDRQPTRRTLLVTDDPDSDRPLRLAAEIPAETTTETSVEVVSPQQLDSVAWEEMGLVIWHAPLPKSAESMLLQAFVDADGQIIFLPSRIPGGERCFGLKWDSWKSVPEDITIRSWRGDAGLLANTRNGMALPVGELMVRNSCSLQGDFVPLASLSNDQPLLVRVPTDRGAVYALATTAADNDSSLASNGIVLYVMIQRALADGSDRLSGARQAVAGNGDHDSTTWHPLAGAQDALSHQLEYHAGVYQAGNQLLAFNRADPEDAEVILDNDEVDRLFENLEFVRVEDRAGSASPLIREIWRLFLFTMLMAMVLEAALCLPRRRTMEGAPA